jgi:hypothetical protein
MALLIVEHDGKVQAGVISGRVVIGRRPEDQVRARDKSVSPVHAWIDLGIDGTHFVADAGSQTGTFVNDRRIEGRQPLPWGDRIRIGPLSLRLEDGEAIPEGAETIDLRERPLPRPSAAKGISFNCGCGAPVWAPWSFAGKSGKCRSCGAAITVPVPAATTSHCGVCHAAIGPAEETHCCPACNTVFHVECWTDNGGCSVYGCSQVNVLSKPPEPPAKPVDEFIGDDASTTMQQGVPWAYVLLGASVLGTVAGALTFGATGLLAAAAAVVYLFRAKPNWQRRIVFLSIAVALVGSMAGMALSYYWWMGGRPWQPMR